ncbi:MAG: hypothetical protein QMD01_04890, partial [Thermodesulfovibrionales bacterium]|nr:hypothetical protein [Thermodesulfovibrionales bacterium]
KIMQSESFLLQLKKGTISSAPNVSLRAQGTVFAIIDAGIGKKGFQKNSVSSVRKRDRIEPLAVEPSPPAVVLVSAAGTGHVIL